MGGGLCFSVECVGTLDRTGSPIPQSHCCDEQTCGFKALGQKPVLSQSVNNGSTQNVLVDMYPPLPENSSPLKKAGGGHAFQS